ncbi:signal transducer and transcription activator isoform X2 [Scaptodrosophila lebanonensis]|uniref:Signal transducer and activator of transcription n=1 Tax=Drosophila lebanonensis TaxID=7225 RepID=A0A6J2T359_DROLE|nr:signal transducer and transcription activator isoform X2 [Scaptodrosophila lebanonensis]
MSLWKRISSHADCEQRMAAYYDEKGLLDLRLSLAPWIEDRIMSEQLTPSSTDQYERIALKFNEDLQQKLLSTRTSSDQTLKYRIVELCALIQRTPAVELYTYLRSGLQKELQLAAEKTVVSTGCQSSMPLNPYMNMNNTAAGLAMGSAYMDTSEGLGAVVAPGVVAPGVVGPGVSEVMHNGSVTPMPVRPKIELYNVTVEIQRSFNDFMQCVKALNMLSQSYHYVLNQHNNPDAEATFKRCIEEKGNIVALLRRSFMCYEFLQDLVITELKNWRRQQALAGNGAPFNETTLDEIQRCFEQLEVFVTQLLSAVKETIAVRLMNAEDIELTQLLEQIQCAQKNLVCSAFIVDKQPPQVMKTNTRFAASVRWLLGSQLGLHMNPPTVECIIMSELQAQRFVSKRTHEGSNCNLGGQSSGEIQNCASAMEYQQNTHVFSAGFRNMQLKKIKRAEKKGTESVMDEKFALCFFATTTVNDYQIHVWTLSLPVVVIVHGNQEPQSWATITWDNAFADIVRDPFVVTDRVTWAQLSIALNTKFGSTTQRALTGENLDFLYEKLQRDNVAGEYISWNQFCKEPLPDRNFTFWDWFFAIMKLTKDHLLSMWKAGRITGFINRAKAQNDLMQATTGIGTFLVRFSDSELGGVTIAYVNQYGTVTMVSPWIARDLQIINLADRIRDLDALRCLHPTDVNVQPLDRDSAFGEFYTTRDEEKPRSDGYVRTSVHVRTGDDTGSISGTPHHPMQSPHQDSMSMPNLSPIGGVVWPTTDDSDSDDSLVAETIESIVMNTPLDHPLVCQISNTIFNVCKERERVMDTDQIQYADHYGENACTSPFNQTVLNQ